MGEKERPGWTWSRRPNRRRGLASSLRFHPALLDRLGGSAVCATHALPSFLFAPSTRIGCANGCICVVRQCSPEFPSRSATARTPPRSPSPRPTHARGIVNQPQSIENSRTVAFRTSLPSFGVGPRARPRPPAPVEARKFGRRHQKTAFAFSFSRSVAGTSASRRIPNSSARVTSIASCGVWYIDQTSRAACW